MWHPPVTVDWMMSQGVKSPRHMLIMVMPKKNTKAPERIEMMQVFLSRVSQVKRRPWNAS
jgi:hypothetical protein